MVNSSKGCMLMVVRVKDDEMFDTFKGYDPNHKKELFEIISDYDELF